MSSRGIYNKRVSDNVFMNRFVGVIFTLGCFTSAVAQLAAQPASDAACTPNPVGHVETVPLASRVFHNYRNLRVWLPAGYELPANAKTHYPVLYLLDGASVFDACSAYKHETIGADKILTDLIAAGKIPPVIAVAIENGSDAAGPLDTGQGRAREFLPWFDPWEPDIRDTLGQHFPDFLADDVMPLIQAKYRTLDGNSTLWGASYGGVAALYTAIHRPELFDAIIAESPSIQPGNGQLLRDTVSLVLLPPKIALGIGTAEFGPEEPDAALKNAAWVRGVRQLTENLKATAYIHPSVQLTVAEGAHHSMVEFGARLTKDLLFVYTK